MITKFNNFLLEFRNDILANPNFVKWFGNSKGVDEHGNPKVYYHATKSNFDEFKRGEFGIHFGTIKQVHDIFIKNTKVSLIPVYLKFENPIRLSDLKHWQPVDIIQELHDNYDINISDNWKKYDVSSLIWDDIIEELKKLGYDSVIYKNEYEGNGLDDSIIVFDANQIKSAIGNTKFNPKSGNINESKSIKSYSFYKLCDDVCREPNGLDAKNKMIYDSKKVSKSTFVKNCNYANELFKYENYMLDDPSVGFYKSQLRDIDCYYMQYRGFEFIFLKEYPTGSEYWLD